MRRARYAKDPVVDRALRHSVRDGMAFSEEIKIEALKSRSVRFAEISIMYSSRLGEIKLNPWRDGFYNLWFLVKKRFS